MPHERDAKARETPFALRGGRAAMIWRRGEPAGGARFDNREDAGRALAGALREYGGRSDVVVLGLPRGGVPVAAEVARALGAPLDVFVVRKIGAPTQPELAMGAVSTGGVVVVNEEIVRELAVSREEFDEVAAREKREVGRREQSYRGNRPAPDLSGKVVILVDDGLATGATMRAAVEAVRRQGPSRVIVAVPVAALDTCEQMRREADEVVCGETPEPFLAVGLWYRDFSQTSDEEVRDLLERSRISGARAG
jgi:predicted phosphoribosyltransferase